MLLPVYQKPHAVIHCSVVCRDDIVAAALASRRQLLVTIASGLLSAISYCHQRGVAHCGIGAGKGGGHG